MGRTTGPFWASSIADSLCQRTGALRFSLSLRKARHGDADITAKPAFLALGFQDSGVRTTAVPVKPTLPAAVVALPATSWRTIARQSAAHATMSLM